MDATDRLIVIWTGLMVIMAMSYMYSEVSWTIIPFILLLGGIIALHFFKTRMEIQNGQ